MTKKKEMYTFLKCIESNNLMTKFLINIFHYDGLEDYNYISRIGMNENLVILDIYDNVTENRFNRYCFNFDKDSSSYFNEEYNNVFITNIAINNSFDEDNNFIKLSYMFKISKSKRVEYAKTFLDDEFIKFL